MSSKWTLASSLGPGYCDPIPRITRGGHETVDFRQKGDTCTVFLKLPAHVTLPDVSRVMRVFGPLRCVSSFGVPGADGSWDAIAGYWTAGEAWVAQRELKARGRELWGRLGSPGVVGTGAAALPAPPAGAAAGALVSSPPLGEAAVHARLGVKRRAAADAVARGADGGDGLLSATQAAQMLNALLPLQWSNTLVTLEVQAVCRRRAPAAAPAAARAGPALPGGVPSAWDEGAGAFLPPAQATVVGKRQRRGESGAEAAAVAAAAVAAAAAGEGEEEVAAGERGAAAAAAAAATAASARDRFTLEEEDGADPDAPLPLPAQRLQAAKYADFCSRCVVPTAASLAEAHGEARLARVRPASMMGGLGSLPIVQRGLAVPYAPAGVGAGAGAAAPRPPPHAHARARPPCAFVRQVLTIHNPSGGAVVASSGGGCACRHREETAAVAMALERAPGAPRSPPRVCLTGACALVAAPGGAPVESPPLPLSQQPPPAEGAPPPGAPAHSRYALSSRKWTVEDVVDGIPVKFTVAEAFQRACEGIRVQVHHPAL
jgi:hypothetical protein